MFRLGISCPHAILRLTVSPTPSSYPMFDSDLEPVQRFGDPEAPVPIARIDQGEYQCSLSSSVVPVPRFEAVPGIEHRCAPALEMILSVEKNGSAQIADLSGLALI